MRYCLIVVAFALGCLALFLTVFSELAGAQSRWPENRGDMIAPMGGSGALPGGCATAPNGDTWCSTVDGYWYALNSVAGGASIQASGIDTTAAGTFSVGGTNATAVSINPATNVIGNLTVNTNKATITAATGLTTLGNGTMIINPAVANMGIYGPVLDTNTAPGSLTIHPPGSSPAYTQAAGNLMLSGGAGAKTVTFSAANPDTTCPTANAGGATTVVVAPSTGSSVTFTYGTDFCIGSVCSTVTLAAANFAAALQAKEGTLAGVLATNAAGVVQITVPYNIPTLSSTFSGATCGSASNGTDGIVEIGTSCIKLDPGNLFPGTAARYLYQYNGTVTVGGSCVAAAGTATFYSGYHEAKGGIFQSSTTANLSSLNDGTGSYGMIVSTAKGAQTLCTQNVATATFAAGGTAAVTLTGLVPLGAKGVGVTGRVTVAESGGGCTSFSVGDGTTTALYALTVPPTLAQRFGPTIASYGPTGVIKDTQRSAAGNVVLTSVGGAASCQNLVVRVTVHYCIDAPDTVN